MKLNKPKGNLTQGFAKNYNSAYASQGLKGHTGEDYVIGWKRPIEAVVDGEVYSTFNKGTTNYDNYKAVFQIVDDGEFSYEISYGHLDKIYVNKGDVLKAGQLVGTEGNFGLAYSGGVKVTKAQKLTGKGSHLHFQVRKCKRVKERERGKKYLRHSNGYLKRDDKYYEIVNYDNGYNGCVDPIQFYGAVDTGKDLTFRQILNIVQLLIKLGFIKK